jgi:hypothetical protein
MLNKDYKHMFPETYTRWMEVQLKVSADNIHKAGVLITIPEDGSISSRTFSVMLTPKGLDELIDALQRIRNDVTVEDA